MEEKKLNFESPGISRAVSERLKSDIDNYCQTAYDDGHRSHLGASLIGKECSRYLWYVFRWVYHHKFDGRMQRLFNRGHREEERFVEWLRGVGCQVWTHDTSKPANEKGEHPQFRVSGVLGHFGGSCDGIARLPEHYGIHEPVLTEFKTNGTGAAFNKLGDSGMALAKPDHFAQTSVYGYKGINGTKFNYVLYMNINKNDDSLHVEIVKLDHKHGAQLEAKAERIIFSQEPPARLSENPTFRTCAYCDMKGVCHNNKPVEVNCRSCKYARPVDNAQWFCENHNDLIPKEFIKTGCGNHKPIC